ncbi:uncharacterized protein LOC117646049 [Thrips palmi]|uniref:Uncharacterized protein LOC117646049 n=1 Tax=Thrips palmi TaxID=161013 RepID=A0A6P8YRE7_THRPL|nr:uncharacterized protein LOC117646049 [Thrips palmi]
MDLCTAAPGTRQEEKAATLERMGQPGARRLKHIRCRCDVDPAWTLEVLRRAAPTLEELFVSMPREEHLRTVHAMPRLRRMYLIASSSTRLALPALPHGSLEWLRVSGLPQPALVSLLQAHAASLRVLWLDVSRGAKSGAKPKAKPFKVLFKCDLRLSRLVLWSSGHHQPSGCPGQLAKARRTLPGALVQCKDCDRVPWEYL